MKLKMSNFIPAVVIAGMLCSSSYAQQKNVPAKGATGTTAKQIPSYMAEDSLHVIEERLVALAMRGPRYEASDHLNKVNEYQLKKAQSTWLNLLAVSYNVNDQTFKKPSTPATVTNIYPKYTFGVTVPLGIVFSHTDAKSAREQIKMGKNTQQMLARTIRKEVITKFLQYRSLNEIITNLTHTIDDESAAYKQIEESFKNGLTTLEQYNAAAKGYNADNIQRINLQLQQETYKLELEEMIGVPLEDALSGKVQPDMSN